MDLNRLFLEEQIKIFHSYYYETEDVDWNIVGYMLRSMLRDNHYEDIKPHIITVLDTLNNPDCFRDKKYFFVIHRALGSLWNAANITDTLVENNPDAVSEDDLRKEWDMEDED